MDDDNLENDLGNAIEAMVESFDQELKSTPHKDLEKKYWFFEYDPNKSLETNLYLFNDRLNLFRINCRRWEELNNGHTCVVERVRDEYLMPKIREFADHIKNSK